MRSILANFPTEKVKLIKKADSSIIENITALIDSKLICIEDATIPIDEGDIVERELPSGKKEQFIVIDSGFHKGMHGIPDHYQIKYEKATTYHKVFRGQVVNNYNIDNPGKVNINSTDNSVNTYNLSSNDIELFNTLKTLVEQNIENSDEIITVIKEMQSNVGKKGFVEKYNRFIQSIANHMTIFAPFIPALTAFLVK